MGRLRARRFHIPVTAAIAVAIIATLATSPMTAQEPTDVEAGTSPVIAMSVEGRSLAAWAAETMALTLLEPDEVTTCQSDASGRVILLALIGSECVVADGQPIFVPIVARACPFDDRLVRRAQRATGKRKDRLEFRVNALEAYMFRCLHVDLRVLDRPYFSIDGVEVDVDASFFTISEPVTVDGMTHRWPGYYVMLAPLPPGHHTIVTGHEAFEGSPLRRSTLIEIVGADGT